MTLETFFEKFELFADGPGAVAKMRELILDSAAQGLLTARQERDGVASSIVDGIAEEREQLTTKKLIRKQAALADLALEDLPFAAPKTWSWVRLGNCVPSYTDDFIDGPFGSNLKAEEYTESGVPIVRLKNIGRNEFKLKDIKFVSHEKAEQLRRHSFQPGDLLLNKLGEPVGKCCIAPKELGQGIIVADVVRLRLPESKFDTRYVSLVINAPIIGRQFLEEITGITRDRVNLAKVRNLPIPLPPLAEQKRIVAKVNELMALCDRLEAQQQERETWHVALARASLARFTEAPTPANLSFLFHQSYAISPANLRKSILTLAVQGKLVPQDPNDEPAEIFLDRIANSLDVSRSESDETNATTPFELPPCWAWSRFRELGEFGRGKSKHRPRNDPALFSRGNHPLVQTGDVARANGTIESYTGLYNDVGLAQSKKWPAGTLCITIAANIADSGILGFDACFPDSVVGFIPAEPLPSVRYFEYFMRTAKERLEEFAPSTAQKNINLGILEQVWIPIPPLAEQRRIVAKVDELMALVDALETQLATARETASKLLEALVAELTTTKPQTTSKPSNVIELHATPEFQRAVLAAEIVGRMHHHKTFGQTKLQKVIYLAEYIAELREIDSRPRRFARGPHDPELIAQVEEKMKCCNWFEEKFADGRHSYQPLGNPGGHRESFSKLWQDKAGIIHALMDEMMEWKTERCERFATVYAAWNDLIIWGQPVTEDAIFREVLERWHPDKLKTTQEQWEETLLWMRERGYVPKGFGRATAEAPSSELSLD
ncbi:restriction endonuclease subunit S [Roseimicrobium sp. ORNL1]|uniref:restriction endonuclease subunit S n=1 Tax=Roseimicrobium sp. ORNL1 TaxID=2711231 RepID=UPI0013E1ED18|nr:restriction endonuclease subunit S [Roseimicrobium sp. ORNL1]QIF04885.1 hypothetical protein G5S37_26345 [Roseimicrobium sp. ORNL1]